MIFPLARPRLSLWTRITAALAVILVLGLVVFSASPAAHAWLHAHDAAAMAGQHDGPTKQDRQNDGCAITLFAAGILAAGILFLLAAGFHRRAHFVLRYVAAYHRATPRYWLPPLCGPPQN